MVRSEPNQERFDRMNQHLDEPPPTPPSRPSYPVEVRGYAEGDWVIREGDQRPVFFVVLSGHVRIVKGDRVIRTLGEQDVVGLETLLLRIASPFAVRAATACRVSCYGEEALDYFLEQQPRSVRSLLASLVRQLVQASGRIMGAAEDFLGEDTGMVFFGDGAMIIEENSIGAEFYRLVSTEGGLSVSRNQVEVGRLHQPGEFFGEMAGLLGTPRQATVRSIGTSAVQRFSADALDLLLHDYPELATELIKSLASRLARTSARLADPTETGS